MVMAGFMVAVTGTTTRADVVARVDLSSQTMHVKVNGRTYARWKISSGRKGFRTPTGTWRAKWTTKMHYSRKYDYSPMPYSVFYNRVLLWTFQLCRFRVMKIAFWINLRHI